MLRLRHAESRYACAVLSDASGWPENTGPRTFKLGMLVCWCGEVVCAHFVRWSPPSLACKMQPNVAPLNVLCTSQGQGIVVGCLQSMLVRALRCPGRIESHIPSSMCKPQFLPRGTHQICSSTAYYPATDATGLVTGAAKEAGAQQGCAWKEPQQ